MGAWTGVAGARFACLDGYGTAERCRLEFDTYPEVDRHMADAHGAPSALTGETLPAEGEVATCARCGAGIVWEFDDDLSPFGLWCTEDGGRDACTPLPNDEDAYHAPDETWEVAR